jgi:hypothetical protein
VLPWLAALMGCFFLAVSARAGRELAEGLREPEDSPERLKAHQRWNVLAFRLVGAGLIAYAIRLAATR